MDLLTGPMMTVLTGVCSLGLESCCGSKRYCVLSGDVWMELKTIIIKMGLNNHGVVGIGLTRQVRRGDWRWTHVVASSVRNQAYLARPYAMCTKTQPPRKRCKANSLLRAVVRPDNSFACTQWPTTMAGYYAYHRTVWPGQFWLSEVTVCTRFPVAQGLECRVTSLQESCLR